jgi:outer membrane protein W
MRKPVIVAVSCLMFIVVPAFAQQTSHSNTISVFVSDVSLSGSSRSGTHFDAAYGAELAHMFNEHLSAELSITSQRGRQSYTIFSTTAPPVTYRYAETLYPVDASVSWHFLTDGRWKPYLGAGVRYVSNTFTTYAPTGNSRFTANTLGPVISGGVTYQFRPNLGLRFEAKQTLRGNASTLGDTSLSGSIGLSFRF